MHYKTQDKTFINAFKIPKNAIKNTFIAGNIKLKKKLLRYLGKKKTKNRYNNKYIGT